MSTPTHRGGPGAAGGHEIEHRRRGRVTLLFGLLALIALVALVVALLGG